MVQNMLKNLRETFEQELCEKPGCDRAQALDAFDKSVTIALAKCLCDKRSAVASGHPKH